MRKMLAALAIATALALAVACGGGGDDDCVVPDETLFLQGAGEDASPPVDIDAGATAPDADVACHCC